MNVDALDHKLGVLVAVQLVQTLTMQKGPSFAVTNLHLISLFMM